MFKDVQEKVTTHGKAVAILYRVEERDGGDDLMTCRREQDVCELGATRRGLGILGL